MIAKLRKSLLARLSALVTIGAVSTNAVQIEGFNPDESRVYKTIGDTELELHLFYPEDHKKTDQRPAIVFFFGGGWVSGSPSQFFPHCEFLASRGMVAISADYRVKSRHQTTPAECVKDGKSAIRWIRGQAAQLGIDPDRIAAGGGSAGGHVAAAAATVDGFEEEEQDRNISSRPNAMVLFNPVFDNGPNGCGHDKVKDYWRQISPMHNIDETTPPTVVLLGTNDKLIPVKTAQEYQRRMEALDLRCDLYLYEDQTHGFFNYGRGFYEEPLQDMERFLVSIRYLDQQEAAEPGSPD